MTKELKTENSRTRSIRADNTFWDKCKEIVCRSKEYASVNDFIVKAAEKAIWESTENRLNGNKENS